MFNYQSYINSRLSHLKEEGLYRYFLEVNKSVRLSPGFYYVSREGVSNKAVNWCSNDYLGMSNAEPLISELNAVSHFSGTGSGGTRNISGTTNYHRELEVELANWHKKEAALIFNGAYQANVTALQTLGRNIKGLVFISDERNHASIVEGIRGCKNEKKIFRHNDMEHLEELLQSISPEKPKLIVFESVYSMTGTIAPVQSIASLAKKYNALSYIDEVHAVGLYGATGAGILENENLQNEIDIINGTLSKAVGVFGGYIAANASIIDFVRSFGSGFIFTTSLPPAICAAATISIQHIKTNAALRTLFFDNVKKLRTELLQHNISFRENNSHITIIPVTGAQRCREIAGRLLTKYGIYLQPINFPTVPVGEECLRIIITAKHLAAHIHHLAYGLKKLVYDGNNPVDWEKFQAVALAN